MTSAHYKSVCHVLGFDISHYLGVGRATEGTHRHDDDDQQDNGDDDDVNHDPTTIASPIAAHLAEHQHWRPLATMDFPQPSHTGESPIILMGGYVPAMYKDPDVLIIPSNHHQGLTTSFSTLPVVTSVSPSDLSIAVKAAPRPPYLFPHPINVVLFIAKNIISVYEMYSRLISAVLAAALLAKYPLRRHTGMEVSTISSGTRPFWYVVITFLQDYCLIGFIEAGMTFLDVLGQCLAGLRTYN
ncbi:hypothetical protein ARMGADRAFT_1039326 [Armillaria gallica]|uniref:Uncharacterized protein n=1 Tax=Armillaria gallica TaxID=47427 RepID=A0A2H3CEA9_ARMGA|nr:hypothetical protein ARMGADRAFT_1039326 [Armillaria gallica]